MEIKLIDNPVKLAEFLNNPVNTGNIVDSGDKYYIKPDAVYLGIYEGLVLAGVHEVRNFWHSVVECHAVYDPGFRGRICTTRASIILQMASRKLTIP